MKKIFSTLVAVCCAGVLCGADPLFSDDVTFHISFDDKTTGADLSNGRETPLIQFGIPAFRPGLKGQALFCGKGGAKLRFSRKDHLDFDKSGSMVLFYHPLNWEKSVPAPRLFFWGIESAKGYVGMQFANDPKNICACARPIQLMFLYGKNIPNKVYQINAPGKKGCSSWHMLVFSWRKGQVKINYDDQAGKVFDLPFELTDKEFPDQTFSIGSDSDWNYLLDEFTIYGRQLSDPEIQEIYKNAMKDLAKQ